METINVVVTVKNTLGKLSLQIVICFSFFFFYSHVLHLLGNKKMFDNLGPKVVFLPAKINGYRRREKE